MMIFAHRNFDPATGNIKKAHHLVCENCSTPLWKHHDLQCPAAAERRAQKTADEIENFLRRAEDWPRLAESMAPAAPAPAPAEVSDPIVGIVNHNGRIIVAANSGVFELIELIDNQLQRIPMVKS